MRIKRIYQILSAVLIVLPMLVLLGNWERIPDQLPLHFDQFGQADQFGTRRQWLTSISWSILVLSTIRIVFLNLMSRQPGIGRSQLVKLYLSTALLMMGASILLIGQGVWQRPLYQEWLPILFFLFGSSFVYYGVPAELFIEPLKPNQTNQSFIRQLAIRQRVHSLTRLVTIRVNLLTVLVMLFVRGQDRWSVGILANLLVYVFIAGYSFYLRRHLNEV
ncbi:DUF1648 domain-containing protein [Spirosoma sp. KNUC1025]|uniref:DUF1648 domain-containing protein n=1 Tax=Spirosoma sp. KNUC1025 TaxID=2894082 RepID=UPI00386A0DFF|nr:DUF1648 domain-containing protein [Spirosoma sp. KNUC1025]